METVIAVEDLKKTYRRKAAKVSRSKRSTEFLSKFRGRILWLARSERRRQDHDDRHSHDACRANGGCARIEGVDVAQIR
jgi:hypothetical protein